MKEHSCKDICSSLFFKSQMKSAEESSHPITYLPRCPLFVTFSAKKAGQIHLNDCNCAPRKKYVHFKIEKYKQCDQIWQSGDIWAILKVTNPLLFGHHFWQVYGDSVKSME